MSKQKNKCHVISIWHQLNADSKLFWLFVIQTVVILILSLRVKHHATTNATSPILPLIIQKNYVLYYFLLRREKSPSSLKRPQCASDVWSTKLYLVLQSQFPCGQIQPVWCSSHRSHCCRGCWPGLCPEGRFHHLSCRCKTQLKSGEQIIYKNKEYTRANYKIQ